MGNRCLITGPAGSGTTLHILRIFAKMLQNNDSDELLMLVPNYFHLQNIQNKLTNDFGIRGFRGDIFNTIKGLVGRFAPETQISHNWDIFTRLLLKEILSRSHIGLSKEGTYAGFRRKLGHLFHEIRAQNSSRRKELLNMLMKEYPDGPVGKGFVARVAKAFVEFENELEKRNICSPEDSLFKAANKIESIEFSGSLFITGFDDLEEPQFAIVSALAQNAKNVYITLPYGDDWQFEQSVFLRHKFLEIGFKEEKLLQTSRFTNSSLSELEKTFRKGEKLDNFENIFLYLIDGEREEIDFVTREAAEMINNGLNPNDILLIHPNPLAASLKLEAAFEQLGIPFKTVVETPIKTISPARDLIAILGLLTGNFELATSLSVSRYSPVMRNLYNYADKRHLEKLISGENAECPDEKISNEWQILKFFIEKSKTIKSSTDFTNFVNLIIKKSIFMPDKITADYGKLAASSWNSLMTILDEMSRYYADEEISDENVFHALLQDFLNEANNQFIKSKDRRQCAINLVSFDDSRLRSARVVFLSGMNDVNFPPRVFQDPILGDSIRQELVSRGFRFETTSGKINRNQYLLYSALTRASEKLFITCPVFDDRGEPLEISPSIVGLFPSERWTNATSKPRPIFTLDDLITAAALNLNPEHNGIENKIKKNLEKRYPKDSHVLTNYDPLICDIKTEIPEAKSYDASRLENYVECPFIYFAKNVLKIHEGPTSLEKILNPLIRGIAVHDFLAKSLSKNPQNVIFKEILEKLLQDSGYSLDDIDFNEESFIYDLENVLSNFVSEELDKLKKNELEIIATEMTFGYHEKDAIKIDIDGVEKSLAGRIDRVDRLPDGTHAVYDYKTSSKMETINEKFKEALKFQIPVYIIALKQLGLKLSEAGVIIIARDGSSFKTNKTFKGEPLNIDEIENNGRNQIYQTVKSIESKEFPPHPSNKKSCGWDKCGYYHVCRIDK